VICGAKLSGFAGSFKAVRPERGERSVTGSRATMLGSAAGDGYHRRGRIGKDARLEAL
jgi:hypothetical protein